MTVQVVLHPEDPELASYFLFYRWGAHAYALCLHDVYWRYKVLLGYSNNSLLMRASPGCLLKKESWRRWSCT